MESVKLSDAVTLYCADAYELAPTLAADVCVTDPPYEITAAGGGIGATRKYLHDTEGFTDCGFDYSLLSAFDNWACFGTLRQVPALIEASGDRRWMLVTWNKPNPCPLVSGNYLPDTEYIVHAWRSGGLHGTVRDKARFIVHRLGDKDHLFLGTRSDNNRDMIEKGRHRHGSFKTHVDKCNYMRGDDHWNKKYDTDMLKSMIIDRQGGYSFSRLSRKHGISTTHAWRIVHGKQRKEAREWGS